MPAVEIDVGRLVAGKYELVRLIGKGAMGEVWLATHNTLGGEFAIKLVKPSDDEEDDSAAGRFQLEAQISAKLSRKTRHIVSVSDHGEEDGIAYLVMELLEGESLDARITRTGALGLEEIVGIVMQIARALGQAHAEQIFHRDLKPANVFLTKDEDGRLLVKLLDFGIARAKSSFRTRSPFMTGKDMVLGTPSYMSPEQARGLDSLDHRCDVWALAVVAYEALTMEIPWEGESVEDIFLSICTHRVTPITTRRRDLPPAIEAVFARSFAPKLDDRFPTAAELSDAFELLVDSTIVDAAMGARPGPASSRRLAVASNHDLSSEPAGMAVGGPTFEVARHKRSYVGWLIAAAAAMATIGIVVFTLTALSARGTKTMTRSPIAQTNAPTTTPKPEEHVNAPPPPPPPPPPPLDPVTTAPARTVTKGSPPRPAAPAGRPAHAVAEPAPSPPPPATTVAPVVTAAPAPPPPPPPASTPARKPVDRGEVF